MKKSGFRRNGKGSTLVEGVAGIVLVVGVTVMSALLMLNSATILLCKTKLTHINYLATAYAASHGGDVTLQDETTNFVRSLMPEMGLIPANLTVGVKPIHIEENAGVQVTIANDFPLCGNAFGISKICLHDTEIVVW